MLKNKVNLNTQAFIISSYINKYDPKFPSKQQKTFGSNHFIEAFANT